MLTVLAWIVSADTKFFQDAAKILERQHDGIELVGAATGDEISTVDTTAVDVLLVVGAKDIGMSKINQIATQLHLPAEKLLGDWIICIPGFTLDKYRRLQRSRLSIFSRQCFGGIMYHTLGLPFRSPFVNMFMTEPEFIRFLRAPRVYMEERPTLKEMIWSDVFNFHTPIITLGNIDLNMNHYRDFDEAVAKWKSRKDRINWYNLFVTMSTDSEEILQQFDELPYGKKACFVPFKSDLDSAWYIKPTEGIEIWGLINNFAHGNPFYYDPFDMLLYGKKTPLIEM